MRGVTKKLFPLADYFEKLLEDGRSPAEEAGASIRCWPVMEEGVATYVVFKENDGDGARLADIVPIVERLGWVRHHNGNNLALIPPRDLQTARDEFPLARLRRHEPHRPVAGYGDSVTDALPGFRASRRGAPSVSKKTYPVVNATASTH